LRPFKNNYGQVNTLLTLLFASAILPLCLASTGCGGGRSEADNAGVAGEADKLNAIQSAYFAFVDKNRRPPNSAEELEKYFASDVDTATVYTSDRDKQPYVIFWGADFRKHSGATPFVIAHEKEGSGGVRMVFTGYGVMEMSEEQMQTGVSYPPGEKAPGEATAGGG